MISLKSVEKIKEDGNIEARNEIVPISVNSDLENDLTSCIEFDFPELTDFLNGDEEPVGNEMVLELLDTTADPTAELLEKRTDTTEEMEPDTGNNKSGELKESRDKRKKEIQSYSEKVNSDKIKVISDIKISESSIQEIIHRPFCIDSDTT